MNEFLRLLREWNAACREARDAITAGLQTRQAAAPAGELVRFTADEDAEFRRLAAEVAENDERIAEIELQLAAEARSGQVAIALGSPVVVKSEPRTYERGNGQSWMRDLVKRQIENDPQSHERLARHAQEIRVDAAERVARGDIEFRDISRTDGAGGEFVPPLWLVDQYAALARAARVTADLCQQFPLPGGTDSINIPRVTTGTAVAAQTADNASVQETDIVSTSVSVPVITIAGQQDVAIQLIDQSPVSVDEIIFADLAADYAAKLDVQVLNGTGSSGQATGFLALSGTNSVSYTDASPTVPELYPKLADAVQQVGTNRFLPATAIVMHTRRWGWITAALDSSNRPLVVPTQNGPYMAEGVLTDVQAQGGPVGSMHGLPVYLDPNIPTTLGGGTEDAIIVARFADAFLWEGVPRTRVLPEVLSSTLTVRLQLFNYVAFTAGRYPKATSKVTGTGLAAPSF